MIMLRRQDNQISFIFQADHEPSEEHITRKVNVTKLKKSNQKSKNIKRKSMSLFSSDLHLGAILLHTRLYLVFCYNYICCVFILLSSIGRFNQLIGVKIFLYAFVNIVVFLQNVQHKYVAFCCPHLYNSPEVLLVKCNTRSLKS